MTANHFERRTPMTILLARSSLSALVSAVLAASVMIGCGGEPAATDETTPVQQAATATPRPNGGAVQVNDNVAVVVGAGSSTGSGVVDSTKCPERIEGKGAGDLVGGMCIYPKPPGGCAELGLDCNEVFGEAKCRCPQKSVGSGLPGDPGQVMSPY
jgi:hypothetical protein